MHAYLGEQAETALPCEHDPGGWLLTMDLPSGIELSLSDAYDGVGPLALRHYADGREPEEYPVWYDDVDGVEVYRITTPDGPLIVPARHVRVMPPPGR